MPQQQPDSPFAFSRYQELEAARTQRDLRLSLPRKLPGFIAFTLACLWGLAGAAVLFVAFLAASGLRAADSAPKEAALGALVTAMLLGIYVLARCADSSLRYFADL